MNTSCLGWMKDGILGHLRVTLVSMVITVRVRVTHVMMVQHHVRVRMNPMGPCKPGIGCTNDLAAMPYRVQMDSLILDRQIAVLTTGPRIASNNE